jgi:hypothetical protein
MGRCDRPAPRSAQARGRALGFAVGAAVVLAGCGSTPSNLPDAGGPVPPVVWQPKPGDAPNWDIQLAAPFDVSAPRTMYDLDLWSLVPAQTTLDYGDGAPVTVPAGELAGTIAELHARTPPAIVICYVETGVLDLQRPDPDAVKFPGYDADRTKIPDNPDPPSPGSVIGWNAGAPGLRFLDTGQAGGTNVAAIVFKRFDLAVQIGCDGIDTAHDDTGQLATGFTITSDDAFSWHTQIAQEGHTRKLSTGMRGIRPELTSAGANQFDWLILERCGEQSQTDPGTCDALARPFLNAQKDVFAIEYNVADDGTSQAAATVCQPQRDATITDGLYKNFPPSGDATVRQECMTATP